MRWVNPINPTAPALDERTSSTGVGLHVVTVKRKFASAVGWHDGIEGRETIVLKTATPQRPCDGVCFPEEMHGQVEIELINDPTSQVRNTHYLVGARTPNRVQNSANAQAFTKNSCSHELE
jgi:hypothetical protein